MSKYKAHIISHSHWDREWYFSFEEFRIKLVDMVDKLLKHIEENSDYDSFMFDGHTALIEDYLEVKPQNRNLLKKAIESGKIKIGPWYILPDEILISGESHVRNYLYGQELCKEFGGKMNIGYLPDAFGHPSQIPQILKKLGLEEMLFWRGLSDNITKNEFFWKSPDGSSILGIHLPFGYGNCPNMPNEPEAFLKRVEYVIERYLPTSTTNIFPIMNGRDHLEAQEHITDMVMACVGMNPDIEMCHSNLESFVKELRENLNFDSLEHHDGELRSSDKTLLLGGTVSTRMYLKQLNQHVEDLYEKWLEPFCTVSGILNASKYPADIIRHGWKTILKNHPHDSICGCSIDEVHREMVVRFNSARQIGDTMVGRALNEIVGADVEQNDECWISVFNPFARPRSEAVNCVVDFHPRLASCIAYEKLARVYLEDTRKDLPLPKGIALEDGEGNVYPAVLESAEIVKDLRHYTYKQPHEFHFHRCKFSFLAQDIPPVGYKMFKVKFLEENTDNSLGNQIKDARSSCDIENEHFKVEVSGVNIHVLDKANNKWYRGCGALVDGADSGDEYTYSHIENDFDVYAEAGSAEVTTDNEYCKRISIKSVMRLPLSITEDSRSRVDERVECPITTEISIFSHASRVDFKVTFDNRAKDHRLRAYFPTDFNTDRSWAESTFSVDERLIGAKQAKDEGEIFFTDSQKTFVSIDNGNLGLTIANKGLPEYEAIKTDSGTVIAVTLLRCVSRLSKDELLTRKGDAAWNIETPEAQCLGESVFEFSMIAHKGNWSKCKVYKTAHDYCNPMRVIQAGVAPRLKSRSFVSISKDELILSAFKYAHFHENTVILRFYNTSDKDVSADVKLGFDFTEAYFCDLKEDKIKAAQSADGTVKVTAKPWEIITIALEIAGGISE